MRSHEILDFCDLSSVPQSIFEITVAIIILVLRYVCTIGKLFIGIDRVHVSGKDSPAIINGPSSQSECWHPIFQLQHSVFAAHSLW